VALAVVFLPPASAHGVTASITHFVSTEVIERSVSVFRTWTSVAVMWIEAVINVAVEVVRTVEPRTGSDEHTAIEPLWPVVSVRSTVIRREVVVAVRAYWFRANVDGDLSGSRAGKS
jgi:hypothetical protein